jgi:hypothetical protein
MERVAPVAAPPQAARVRGSRLKQACSETRNVFLYCDTVTARLLQNSDCWRGNFVWQTQRE